MGNTTTVSSLPEQLPAILAVRRFRAMNTDVEVRALDLASGHRLADVEDTFARIERTCSRFRPDSDLSRLNDTGHMRVGAELFALLEVAQPLHTETQGLFDPMVLPALRRWGYDRSFELIGDVSEVTGLPSPASSFRDMRLDSTTREVMIPPGSALDLGGVGKGWAVDVAIAQLADVSDVQVNAGGDQFARGHCGDGNGWPAAVIHPHTDEIVSLVRLHDQALATSSTAIRRWRAGARVMHHIIDPRTGESANSGVASASVIAPTAVEADVFAKCALLLGDEHGREFAMRRNVAALFIGDDGSVIATDDWPGAISA